MYAVLWPPVVGAKVVFLLLPSILLILFLDPRMIRIFFKENKKKIESVVLGSYKDNF